MTEACPTRREARVLQDPLVTRKPMLASMAKLRTSSKCRDLTMVHSTVWALLLGLAAWNLLACGEAFTACEEGSTCATAGASGTHGGHAGASYHAGSSGTAGNTGESGAAGEGSTACDASQSPSVDSCVISDEYAVFVDPSGKDSAAGTKHAPVQTITKALELAGEGKAVIACIGSYDEQIELTRATRLYGGFTCASSATPWTYRNGKRAKLTPSAPGPSLSISAGTAAIVIEDFEFNAKDAHEPGESSIAAFLNASSNVALTRVKLLAGKGVDGADGTLTPVTFPMQSVLNGKPASGETGGGSTLVACPVGGSTGGGRGGDGGILASGGGSGAPALGGGAPGMFAGLCAGSGSGGNGAAAAAQPAASGALNFGSITPTGWSGAPGTDGAHGTPGQGGGGGTGAATGGAGGGGGAGGCGGAGGSGGKAGGSSIALLLLNSTPTINASEFVSSDAGKGGKGSAGQDGQAQAGNAGVQVPNGCSGGKGGAGGAGGAGGGAAGGLSVGIAYQGSAPSTDADTTFSVGVAGTKGVGGVAGTNDGIDGEAHEMLEVP